MIYLENSASTCIAACCTNMNGNLEKMTFFSFKKDCRSLNIPVFIIFLKIILFSSLLQRCH